MSVEVDACDGKSGDEQQTVKMSVKVTADTGGRNVQFKTAKPRRSSHRVPVCHDIGCSITLWQEVEVALLVAIPVVVISAGVSVICDDLVCCDL